MQQDCNENGYWLDERRVVTTARPGDSTRVVFKMNTFSACSLVHTALTYSSINILLE